MSALPASITIDPPDFTLPPGPTCIVIQIHRDALQHFDPSIDPLEDTDSVSRVLEKGKVAMQHVRRDISLKLFGTDVRRSAMSMSWPLPGRPATAARPALGFYTGYAGFYFEWNGPLDDVDPTVYYLTSEPDLVDGCVLFRAAEADENKKAAALEMINQSLGEVW